mgnify:CR=1 FL=1
MSDDSERLFGLRHLLTRYPARPDSPRPHQGLPHKLPARVVEGLGVTGMRDFSAWVLGDASARLFGDVHDPESEVSQAIRESGGYPLMPEWGTQPANHYLPRRKTKLRIHEEIHGFTGCKRRVRANCAAYANTASKSSRSRSA